MTSTHSTSTGPHVDNGAGTDLDGASPPDPSAPLTEPTGHADPLRHPSPNGDRRLAAETLTGTRDPNTLHYRAVPLPGSTFTAHLPAPSRAIHTYT